MIVGDAVGMDEGSMVIVPASESTASLTVDQQQPQPSKPPSVYEHEDDEPDSTETFVEVPSPTTHHQSYVSPGLPSHPLLPAHSRLGVLP
jgi:hypothetical protein